VPFSDWLQDLSCSFNFKAVWILVQWKLWVDWVQTLLF